MIEPRNFILTVIGVMAGRPRIAAGAYTLEEIIDGTAVLISKWALPIDGSQQRGILTATIAGIETRPAGSGITVQSADENFIVRLQGHGDHAATNYRHLSNVDLWRRYAQVKAGYSVEARHLPRGRKYDRISLAADSLARAQLQKSLLDETAGA